MQTFKLTRFPALEEGAFGVLLDVTAREVFAVTVERTYEDLLVKIPPGSFICPRDFFHRGGYETYLIPVPGHDRILLHVANVETELEGCVGVGRYLGRVGGKRAVLSSRAGFAEFMRRCGGAPELRLIVELF